MPLLGGRGLDTSVETARKSARGTAWGWVREEEPLMGEGGFTVDG
jgi:hypothetical protein